MTVESRVHADLRLEQRAGQKGRKLVGYASVFNTNTTIAGVFQERVAPGAFRKTIAGDDIRALVDHDQSQVLGRTRSGTLRLVEDDIGLRVEIDPPDTQLARDLLHLIERGDVTGMSFGFVARGEDWQHDVDPPQRTLTDVQLLDVSVVTYPAYPEAGVALRSLLHSTATARREKLLAAHARRSPASPRTPR